MKFYQLREGVHVFTEYEDDTKCYVTYTLTLGVTEGVLSAGAKVDVYHAETDIERRAHEVYGIMPAQAHRELIAYHTRRQHRREMMEHTSQPEKKPNFYKRFWSWLKSL